MRTNIEQLGCTAAQRTAEWYKQRLGHFTGSQVGRLMKRGRGKDAEWSADALTYIQEVASERLINPVVMDVADIFDDYMNATQVTSRAMSWGIDHEDEAIDIYEKLTKSQVTRVGSIAYEGLPFFTDSPDGLLLDKDGVIEVKCPQVKTHCSYLATVFDAESLKSANEVYYWQTMAHMAVTGASFCLWASYNPFCKPAMMAVKIERNQDEINQLVVRVQAADELCNEFVAKAKNRTLAVV